MPDIVPHVLIEKDLLIGLIKRALHEQLKCPHGVYCLISSSLNHNERAVVIFECSWSLVHRLKQKVHRRQTSTAFISKRVFVYEFYDGGVSIRSVINGTGQSCLARQNCLKAAGQTNGHPSQLVFDGGCHQDGACEQIAMPEGQVIARKPPHRFAQAKDGQLLIQWSYKFKKGQAVSQMLLQVLNVTRNALRLPKSSMVESHSFNAGFGKIMSDMSSMLSMRVKPMKHYHYCFSFTLTSIAKSNELYLLSFFVHLEGDKITVGKLMISLRVGTLFFFSAGRIDSQSFLKRGQLEVGFILLKFAPSIFYHSTIVLHYLIVKDFCESYYFSNQPDVQVLRLSQAKYYPEFIIKGDELTELHLLPSAQQQQEQHSIAILAAENKAKEQLASYTNKCHIPTSGNKALQIMRIHQDDRKECQQG